MKLFRLFFIVLLICAINVHAQTISLTHTGTQYDAFENPVQQSFDKNESRKYAVNLLPSLNGFVNFKGDAETAFTKYIFTQSFKDITVPKSSNNNINQLDLNGNFYLFNFRIFKTTNYNRELGFSLQFKDEAKASITNETFLLLNSYTNFDIATTYSDILNTKGFNQSYWHLAATYRENYNNKWGFGAKIGLLQGATLSNIAIDSSSLSFNSDNSYTSHFRGTYTSTFGTEKFKINKLLPSLKNFGAAISLGASYTSPKDLYLTFNLKDLGFIRWGKTSYYQFDDDIKVSNADSTNAINKLFSGFNSFTNGSKTEKSFYKTIDTKVDFAASREFGFYKPIFVFSKSIFRSDGQIALINTLNKNAFNFSFNGIYDLNTKFNFGSQVLIKSPNAEFYLGSEQLFPSYYFAKGYLKKDENIGKSNPKASVYIGLNIKFGRKMQDMGNADEIPGLNDKETGYVVRLSKKERKRLRRENKNIEKRRNKNDKRNSK